MEAASNYFRIVNESLTDEREVDERTFASLAVFTERLERLRGLDSLFSDVDFSPDVKRIRSRAHAVPVG
ncbi:MAG: hypothetical protein A2173_10585 [Planctomycetes bacterium RBG_13_44_8b]|nr:MAG: hypothetical protein A2173_10585 [Planctomycetes bacterium RBG_13_44_8b]